MTVLTVTAKGQITLRKDLLRHLGVGPGDRLEVEVQPSGRIEMRAAKPGGDIAGVFGMLKRPGTTSLSIEEMNQIAAEGWAGKR